MIRPMHALPLLLSFFSLTPLVSARTLEVRAGGTYTTLQSAAAAVRPGDTILFRGGSYAGGEYVANLQGRSDAWITIMAAPGEEVFLRGGANAWQLSDPAWVLIKGFILEGQTGNGMNIDDAGTFETPAHHIIIEGCHWNGIDATGNNDLLKMSGVDTFEVRGCVFRDGSPGGSMIDMVGCHEGSFTGNYFENAGSNCIQSKGGTRAITIQRNTFIKGGERALNIGGSTGLQYFRPQGINYEASDIHVHSNVFMGSVAPIAFVGAVGSEVVNNTIWMPEKWAIRILQETTGDAFLECGDNSFINNIVVVGTAASNPTINIGPNTRPETFTFRNNLWYDINDASWAGPNVPVSEPGRILGSNPRLFSPSSFDFTLHDDSPAIGAGAPVTDPKLDNYGRPFATPRSIGAFESVVPASVRGERAETDVLAATISRSGGMMIVTFAAAGDAEVSLYDLRGERMRRVEMKLGAGGGAVSVPVADLPSGMYLCVLRSGARAEVRKVMMAAGR